MPSRPIAIVVNPFSFLPESLEPRTHFCAEGVECAVHAQVACPHVPWTHVDHDRGVCLESLAVATGAMAMGHGHEETPVPVPAPVPVQEGGAKPQAAVSGEALVSPTVLASKKKKLDVTLTAQAGTTAIAGQTIQGTQTYNGQYVGPTLRVNAGDTLTVHLVNQLDEETNLHFHGLHVSPSGTSDNVFLMVAPGATQDYTIQIPKDHPTGVFWYHPHHHGHVDPQIYSGLSGMILVQGKDKLPGALAKLKTQDLGIKNAVLTNGFLDPLWTPANPDAVYTVNGQLNPQIAMKRGESQVWNLANLGNDAWYRLKFEGSSFQILGEDGGLLAKPMEAQEILLGPAERAKVLIRADETGSFRLLQQGYVYGSEEDNSYPPVTLATAVVDAKRTGAKGKVNAAKVARMKIGHKYFEDLATVTPRATRTIEFDQFGDSVFGINGESFPNVAEVLPKLDSVEEWTITNPTYQTHPFHLHTNNFQVISVNGVATGNTFYQDTVPVPPVAATGEPGSVVVRMRFADFTGTSVYHCHIPRHEDRGMMGVVTVIE